MVVVIICCMVNRAAITNFSMGGPEGEGVGDKGPLGEQIFNNELYMG